MAHQSVHDNHAGYSSLEDLTHTVYTCDNSQFGHDGMTQSIQQLSRQYFDFYYIAGVRYEYTCTTPMNMSKVSRAAPITVSGSSRILANFTTNRLLLNSKK